MLSVLIFTIVIASSLIDPLIKMYHPSLPLITVYFKFDFFSYMSIATLVLFSIPFAWNTFFHALNFSLYVSLDLNYIFCRRENAWIFWVSFLFDFVLILY